MNERLSDQSPIDTSFNRRALFGRGGALVAASFMPFASSQQGEGVQNLLINGDFSNGLNGWRTEALRSGANIVVSPSVGVGQSPGVYIYFEAVGGDETHPANPTGDNAASLVQSAQTNFLEYYLFMARAKAGGITPAAPGPNNIGAELTIRGLGKEPTHSPSLVGTTPYQTRSILFKSGLYLGRSGLDFALDLGDILRAKATEPPNPAALDAGNSLVAFDNVGLYGLGYDQRSANRLAEQLISQANSQS